MRFLLDTQLVVWLPAGDPRVSHTTRSLLKNAEHEFLFSTVSLWELAIKRGIGKLDKRIDLKELRSSMLTRGYSELPVLGSHALAVEALPLLHKDPFDRILIAQATVEGITLLTADKQIARYPGPVRKV